MRSIRSRAEKLIDVLVLGENHFRLAEAKTGQCIGERIVRLRDFFLAPFLGIGACPIWTISLSSVASSQAAKARKASGRRFCIR
jgi:hypothetical protein